MGYSFQGAGKYGFYEVFKYNYGEKLFPNTNKTLIYLGASASAEFLADIALCPFESIKVRMQTTIPPYASTLREGWTKVVTKEGYQRYWLRIQQLLEAPSPRLADECAFAACTRASIPSGADRFPTL